MQSSGEIASALTRPDFDVEDELDGVGVDVGVVSLELSDGRGVADSVGLLVGVSVGVSLGFSDVFADGESLADGVLVGSVDVASADGV